MLKRLRWQLTLLYLGAALGLVALLGVGSYSLLHKTFGSTTDLAMQYRMAAAFDVYNLPLPQELAAARSTWLDTYAVEIPSSLNSISQRVYSSGEEDQYGGEDEDEDDDGRDDDDDERDDDDGEHSDDDDYSDELEESHEEGLYDARLAALFVLPLGPGGDLLSDPDTRLPLISPDPAGARAALAQGHDWRTVDLQNGSRVRLLTYRTDSRAGPAFIQVGRVLNDQDRALTQFLFSLLLLSSASVLLMGGISWWLSGRSLGPAQKAWDQQQTFIANASHELRTPLTLIRASAEYGLMNDPSPEIRPLLEDIRRECDYMNRQVEDLLLMSRLDARRLKLARKRIVLSGLLQDTCVQVEKLAKEKGIHLMLDGSEGVIQADPDRVRQVLLILLDNAFRFSAPGGVVRMGSMVQGGRVLVQVSDSGSGIAPEHLPHVFDRFYQAGSPNQESGRGNGLGLSIARALVEAMNGSIHLESQVGKGTRVRLVFPAVESAETRSASPSGG